MYVVSANFQPDLSGEASKVSERLTFDTVHGARLHVNGILAGRRKVSGELGVAIQFMPDTIEGETANMVVVWEGGS